MVEATKEIGFQKLGVQGLEISACGERRAEVELLKGRSLSITEPRSLNQPHGSSGVSELPCDVLEELGHYTHHSWSFGLGSSCN